MKTRIGLTTISLAALLITACQNRSHASFGDEDEAAVRAIFDTAVKSARANDWTAWSAVLADDVIYHPPHTPAIHGREAVLKWANALPHVDAIDFQNVQVWGDGDIAYGVSDVTMTIHGLPPDTGKQVAVMRRSADSKWKVVVVSWNSDLPMPTASEPAAAAGN
jgi:ketosteroid isomerase-like protein